MIFWGNKLHNYLLKDILEPHIFYEEGQINLAEQKHLSAALTLLSSSWQTVLENRDRHPIDKHPSAPVPLFFTLWHEIVHS